MSEKVFFPDFGMVLLVVLVFKNVGVYDTTVYSKCCQTSDLWQKLDQASYLASDLRDTRLGQEVAC